MSHHLHIALRKEQSAMEMYRIVKQVERATRRHRALKRLRLAPFAEALRANPRLRAALRRAYGPTSLHARIADKVKRVLRWRKLPH